MPPTFSYVARLESTQRLKGEWFIFRRYGFFDQKENGHFDKDHFMLKSPTYVCMVQDFSKRLLIT